MKQTPRSNRTHIGIFGRCNVGKSSLLNALAHQDRAVVSPQEGTTTDPVYLSMELLPLGPVVLIDTPGLDDTSLVGEQRKAKTRQVLGKSDMALLVTDSDTLTVDELALKKQLVARQIPHLVVRNKSDMGQTAAPLAVSALSGEGVTALKERLAQLRPHRPGRELLEGLVQPQELLVLVTPIDAGAPKGRLILPQQQTLREILDSHAMAAVVQPPELSFLLAQLQTPPALIITDSQAFGAVEKQLPASQPLTSFSILFARKKGLLETSMAGIQQVEKLQEGDRVLVAEGCSHHRQCDDIGTQKIPAGLEKATGKNLHFTFTSGGDFPEDLSPYRLIVHCGSCMLGDREMLSRQRRAQQQQVPMTNYGLLLAYFQNTYHRSVAPFQALLTAEK